MLTDRLAPATLHHSRPRPMARATRASPAHFGGRLNFTLDSSADRQTRWATNATSSPTCPSLLWQGLWVSGFALSPLLFYAEFSSLPQHIAQHVLRLVAATVDGNTHSTKRLKPGLQPGQTKVLGGKRPNTRTGKRARHKGEADTSGESLSH